MVVGHLKIPIVILGCQFHGGVVSIPSSMKAFLDYASALSRIFYVTRLAQFSELIYRPARSELYIDSPASQRPGPCTLYPRNKRVNLGAISRVTQAMT